MIALLLAASVAQAIPWLHDEARALAAARESGRPLLIELQAAWCGACKLLERHTWSDPAVRREIASRFVPLAIDVSEHPEAAEKYGAAELPTLLVFGPGGAVPSARVSGFVRPAELLRALSAGRRRCCPGSRRPGGFRATHPRRGRSRAASPSRCSPP